MSESRFEHWFPDGGETEADAREHRFTGSYSEDYAEEVVERRWSGMGHPDEVVIAVREKATGEVKIYDVSAEPTVEFHAAERE
jgi:hypothetical protein